MCSILLPTCGGNNHNMIEEIRVSIIKIKISNVNMFILCDLKSQCLNHDHVAHVYEYMGAECSKLRQPMRAIFALSRAQLLREHVNSHVSVM